MPAELQVQNRERRDDGVRLRYEAKILSRFLAGLKQAPVIQRDRRRSPLIGRRPQPT